MIWAGVHRILCAKQASTLSVSDENWQYLFLGGLNTEVEKTQEQTQTSNLKERSRKVSVFSLILARIYASKWLPIAHWGII